MASTRDRQILNAIVNPLLPVGEAIFDDEEKLPSDLKDLVEDEQGDSPTLRYFSCKEQMWLITRKF